MPVRLRFSFFGEEQVDRTLGRFERVADMRPAWELLRARFLAWEAETFATSGRGGWAPLSPQYATWKATHYPGNSILVREGTLRGGLTSGPDIDIEEPQFAIFGTGDPVAGYHQAGTDRMPARRVIDLSEAERQEWVRTIARWLIYEAEA